MKYLTPLALAALFVSSTVTAQSASFQMAVVEDTLGAKEIKSGDYAEAIHVISTEAFVEDPYSIIAAKMNLCVAYSNLQQWQLANASCDDAVLQSKRLAKTTQTRSYKQLASIALNNRAMSYVQQDKLEQASDDLRLAIRTAKTDISKRNLIALKQKQQAQQDLEA